MKGTVTRVLPPDLEATIPELGRIFLMPDDPSEAAKLDGSKRFASGEVAVLVGEKARSYKVGDPVETNPELTAIRMAVAEAPAPAAPAPAPKAPAPTAPAPTTGGPVVPPAP